MKQLALTIALVVSATSAFAEEWSQPARELAAITASNYEQWLKVRISNLVKPEDLSLCKTVERRLAKMNEAFLAADRSESPPAHKQADLTVAARAKIRGIYGNYARGVVFCLRRLDTTSPLPVLRPASADFAD